MSRLGGGLYKQAEVASKERYVADQVRGELLCVLCELARSAIPNPCLEPSTDQPIVLQHEEGAQIASSKKMLLTAVLNRKSPSPKS